MSLAMMAASSEAGITCAACTVLPVSENMECTSRPLLEHPARGTRQLLPHPNIT